MNPRTYIMIGVLGISANIPIAKPMNDAPNLIFDLIEADSKGPGDSFKADESPEFLSTLNSMLDACQELVDVTSEDINGSTPLHLAVLLKRVQAVKILLKYHANVNAKNRLGQTPLHIAVLNPIHDIIVALLNVRGIDVNAETLEEGCRPLALAYTTNDHDTIRLLRAIGAYASMADEFKAQSDKVKAHMVKHSITKFCVIS